MRLLKHLVIVAATVLVGISASAATTVIHGVKIEDSATVGGVALQLNGAGTRYFGPFKIYVADLYATKKVGSLEELLAAPGPKRLTMTMLREQEAGPFGKKLTRGIEDNASRTEMSRLVPGLIKMGDIFSSLKVATVGDVIYVDWIPGTGMVVTAKGKIQGEPFKEPEFFKAMMAIWLGPVPADHTLKDALLGTK